MKRYGVKRALAALMALCMAVSLLPVPALAAEEFLPAEESAAAPVAPEAPAPAEPVPEEAEAAAPDMPAPASLADPAAEDLPMAAAVSVARVTVGGNTTDYSSLETAWNAAKAAGSGTASIELLADCKSANRLTWDTAGTLYMYTDVRGGVTVTVPGGGVVFKSGGIDITAGQVYLGAKSDKTPGAGTLTVNNTGEKYDDASVSVSDDASLTCNSAVIIQKELRTNQGGTATLSGGQYSYILSDGKLTCSGDIYVERLISNKSIENNKVNSVDLSGGQYDYIVANDNLTCSGDVHVKTLEVSPDNDIKNKINLCGGTYDSINVLHITSSSGYKPEDMLKDGYCFVGSDNYMMTAYPPISQTTQTISNVRVMRKPDYTAPKAVSGFQYDKKLHALATGGSGIEEYTTGTVDAPNGGWGPDVPQVKNAGTYYVWWHIAPDAAENTAGVKDKTGPVTITPIPAKVKTPPTANELFYNAYLQVLAAGGAAVEEDECVIKYSLERDGNYTDSVSKEYVGTYTVWYRAEGNRDNKGNYTPSEPGSIQVTINPQEVTLKWSDQTEFTYNGSEQGVTVTVDTGTFLKAGVKAENTMNTDAGTYTARVTGLDIASSLLNNFKLPEEGLTKEYTINPATLDVTTPVGAELVYNGEEQTLLQTGAETQFGTVLYSLEEKGEYSETFPKATAAGEHTVWYKVGGKQNWNAWGPESITVTIARVDITAEAPKAAEGLTYDGTEQALLAAGGSSDYGTMSYAVTDNDTAPGEEAEWTETFSNIKKAGAGTYYVWYKVTATDQAIYNDLAPQCIAVTIAKGASGVTAAPTVTGSLVFNTKAQPLLADGGEGSTNDGTMLYAVRTDDAAAGDGDTWTETAAGITGTAPGVYHVWYKVKGDENHLDSEPAEAGAVEIKDAEARIGDAYFLTLEEAVTEANKAGGEIVLRLDAALEKPVDVTASVTLVSEGPVSVSGAAFNVTGKGSLTVKEQVTVGEVTASAGGTVDAKGGRIEKLTVNGMDMAVTGEVTIKTQAGGGDVEVTLGAGTDNSLRVGETTVSGGDDTVTVHADGSVTVPLAGYGTMLLDGRTYTNTGEEPSSVTIYQDGSYHLGDHVSMAILIPTTGLRIAPGNRVECTAGGGAIILEGMEPSGGTVDIDSDGNVTATKGHVSVRGGRTVTEAGGRATRLGDLTVTVKDSGGDLIDGAAVTVTAVTESDAGAVSGKTENGSVTFKNRPYGMHNVEIVYTTEDNVTLTMTGSVTINSVDGNEWEFAFDQLLVSTIVKGSQPTVVDDLDGAISEKERQSATAGSDGSVTSIEITLTSEKKAENPDDDQQNAIRAKIEQDLGAGGSNADFVDVTITKETTTVEGGEKKTTKTEEVRQTASLLTLRFPLPADMWAALKGYQGSEQEHVFVYRYHDAAAQRMRRVSAAVGASAGYECYYLDGSYLVIRASRFSVYAFGVTEKPVDEYRPSTGGGGLFWPTVDKSGLNAAIAAAEALKKDDYTAESWAALETALDAARTVAASGSVIQAEVDDALSALTAARSALVKMGEEPGPGEDEPGPGGEEIKPPAGGTGWRWVESEQTYYYFKNGRRVGDYWVGFADGASQWANNWYYADADGRLLTGLQYLDDLKGGKAWYMLQTTNDHGEMGKMLTGFQWTYDAAVGMGWFSPVYGSQGMCTWTETWGAYSAATGLWADGLSHKG